MGLGAVVLTIAFGTARLAGAQEPAGTEAAALAQKLSNPVAALISVPFQLNYDQDIGLDDEGTKWTLNIQPVVPIALNEDWNIISRTILPVVSQDEFVPGGQSGIGDVVQSVFVSPKARPRAVGSGARARCSCCRRAPTIC